jgi:hypothetical protein
MPKERRRTIMKKAKAKAVPQLAPGPPHTPPELLSPSPRIPEQDDFSKIHNEALRQLLTGLTNVDEWISASEQLVNSLVAAISQGNSPTAPTLALSLLAARAIQALHARAAMGDEFAAKRLYGILRSSVEALNYSAKQLPAAYQPLAAGNLQWPVLYSPHPFFSTDTAAVQAELKVADDYHLKIFGKWKDRRRAYDLSLPHNWLAFKILEKLTSARSAPTPSSDLPKQHEWETECKQLPPLSPQTSDAWVKVGWKAVLHFYHDRPEDDPYLAQLGASLGRGKTKGQVRGRIQTQFRQAMKHLVR